MRDLNFFESYIDKRSFKLNKALILYSFIILGILSLLAYGVYNQIQISKLSSFVNSLQEIAENPKTLEKVEAIKNKEAEVATFREEVEKIRKMDKAIEIREIIDEELLYTITSILPEDLFLTSITIQDKSIQFRGISKDKWSIAEFGKGLEVIEELDEVFISNITLVEDFYNFDLNITLKDVMIGGEGEAK